MLFIKTRGIDINTLHTQAFPTLKILRKEEAVYLLLNLKIYFQEQTKKDYYGYLKIFKKEES